MQFERAAKELAKRDGDAEISKTTVSSRQWERWYSGKVITKPHPDACRVLEYIFGYPVGQLLAPVAEQVAGIVVPYANTADQALAEWPKPAPTDSTAPGYPLSAYTLALDSAVSINDPSALAHFSEALPYYARTSNLLGSEILLTLIERHVRILCAGCETSHGQYRDQVLAACARYAEFLGWLHQDRGNPILSLFWTDRAMEWAQEGNTDRQFQSYVLMRKADHAEQYGTAGRVIGLAQSALRLTALSPRARALAIQQEARGYSQSGEQYLFEQKLDQARELVVSPHGNEDAPWGDYCDLSHIAMQEASGWMELGQFDKAIAMIEKHLPSMPATQRLDSIVFRARLARALAEAGYHDRAAREGHAICPDADSIGSIRAFTELQRVRQILTGAHRIPEYEPFAVSFELLADKVAISERKAQ